MNKRDAVLLLLKERTLIDAPASTIAQEVRRRHRIAVSDAYASSIRKEYKESMAGQTDETPPAERPITQAAPDVTTIDFKSMDAAMDLMLDLNKLAGRVGGMDNLIVLAQKLSSIGVK